MSGGPWPVFLCRGIDPEGIAAEWAWDDLVAAMTWPAHSKSKLSAPGWLPVEMRPGVTRRHASGVASIWAIVVDLDEDDRRFAELIDIVSAQGVVAILHTTWSHTPKRTKARAIFPLESAAPADRWLEVWMSAQIWAASWGATVDPACKDPARLYFLPCIDISEPGRRVVMAEEFDHCVIGPQDRAWLRWRDLVAYHRPPEPPRYIPPIPLASKGRGSQDMKLEIDREKLRSARYVQAAIDRSARDLAETATGGRNMAAFRAAASLGRFVVSGDTTHEAVEAALIPAAMRAGLDQREALKAVHNGLRAAQDRGEGWQGLI